MTQALDKRFWLRLYRVAEEETAALLQELPAPVRDRVADLPIICEAVPGRALVRDGVEPDLMGLFVGNAYGEDDAVPEPTRIFLFLENIWDEADGDWVEYRRQVRQTLLHEIGHYLGLEEDGLIARDLE